MKEGKTVKENKMLNALYESGKKVKKIRQKKIMNKLYVKRYFDKEKFNIPFTFYINTLNIIIRIHTLVYATQVSKLLIGTNQTYIYCT